VSILRNEELGVNIAVFPTADKEIAIVVLFDNGANYILRWVNGRFELKLNPCDNKPGKWVVVNPLDFPPQFSAFMPT
jgi:hypothetical protein